MGYLGVFCSFFVCRLFLSVLYFVPIVSYTFHNLQFFSSNISRKFAHRSSALNHCWLIHNTAKCSLAILAI